LESLLFRQITYIKYHLSTLLLIDKPILRLVA